MLFGKQPRLRRGAVSMLITSLIVLCVLSLSTNAKCPTVQWLIDKCISNSTGPVSKCFTPNDSDISCVGIKNAEDCSKAVAFFSDSPTPQLLAFDNSSFAYNVENDLLCFYPKIRAAESIQTLFGFQLDVEFFHVDNPDYKSLVKLGAIYPSGVSSPQQLQSTVACVAKPAHIPYSSSSYFEAVGYSMPPQFDSNRTHQLERYTLESLARISLDDTVHVKDHFDQSKPSIRFPKGLCETEDKTIGESWFQKHWVILALIAFIVFIIICICAIIFVWYKRRSISPSEQMNSSPALPFVSTDDLQERTNQQNGARHSLQMKALSPHTGTRFRGSPSAQDPNFNPIEDSLT